MAWLLDGEKKSKISLVVLAQLSNVTDRHRMPSIAALCIAWHGKNWALAEFYNFDFPARLQFPKGTKKNGIHGRSLL